MEPVPALLQRWPVECPGGCFAAWLCCLRCLLFKKARGKIDAVELFAGSARICKAFAWIDQKAVAYDKRS
eukprot:939577-Prorocentrum_lima.AAC.1